ncbi:MAG TPA: hypothetical protein VJB94_01420 [Candidatus Nanoarchaeia archaeon]|nr:hypothetical protein [Candidatus Nanoarchaeia archaeon]
MAKLDERIKFRTGRHSNRQVTVLVRLANLRTPIDEIAEIFETSAVNIKNFIYDVHQGSYQGFTGRTIGGSKKPKIPAITSETLKFYEKQYENPLAK